MGNLKVNVDYKKIAQWTMMIQWFSQKIRNEMDRAVIEAENEQQGEKND